MGMTDEELAFYDALEVNDSAVKVLGDEILKKIAKELVEAVRKNVSIDWTVKESARAKLRVIVRRLLRKYGYPPDKQEKATQTVLEQAECYARSWHAEVIQPKSKGYLASDNVVSGAILCFCLLCISGHLGYTILHDSLSRIALYPLLLDQEILLEILFWPNLHLHISDHSYQAVYIRFWRPLVFQLLAISLPRSYQLD